MNESRVYVFTSIRKWFICHESNSLTTTRNTVVLCEDYGFSAWRNRRKVEIFRHSPVCLSESCGGSKFYDVTRALRYWIHFNNPWLLPINTGQRCWRDTSNMHNTKCGCIKSITYFKSHYFYNNSLESSVKIVLQKDMSFASSKVFFFLLFFVFVLFCFCFVCLFVFFLESQY